MTNLLATITMPIVLVLLLAAVLTAKETTWLARNYWRLIKENRK